MAALDPISVAQQFRQDADRITCGLIQLYGLKFKQEISNLNSPLLRWLDFRYRYVDPQARGIVFSDKFTKMNLAGDAKAGLENLLALIKTGADINPYQGRGLILRNDTSGQKRASRTDLLWADWGVLHFHLSTVPIPDGQFFSPPADYLAFCIVGSDIVAFIDVLRHPDIQGFSDPELMRTVHRNWPAYLEPFRLKGMLPSQEGMSIQEIHELRAGGLSSPLTIDGEAFLGPGLGITTASTSLKITRAGDYVKGCLMDLASAICDHDGQFMEAVGSACITDPKFSLAVTSQGLAVYEERSNYAFLLPQVDCAEDANYLSSLHDLILPSWALKALHSQNERLSVRLDT